MACSLSPHTASTAAGTAEPFAAADPARDIDALLACFDTAWGLSPRTISLSSTLESTALCIPNPESLACTASETLATPAAALTATTTVTQAAAAGAASVTTTASCTAINGAASHPTTSTTTTTTAVTAIPMSGSSHRQAAACGSHESEEYRMTMLLPMTPPHAHGPISAAKLIPNGGHLPPTLSHPTPAAPKPVAAPSRANGSGTRASDFASVFFSPIPLSYLSIARSESHDSILAQSVGSPTDATLRGGRLSTAALNSDWAEEAEALSAANALAALQRSRSTSGGSCHTGEAGAEASGSYTTLLQHADASSSELAQKARLAALGNGASNGGSSNHASSTPNLHSTPSGQSRTGRSRSSTSPDSVLSSSMQPAAGSAPGHGPQASALRPLLSRGSAAAPLSSSPAQPIPRSLAGPGAGLLGLQDALLPALSQSELQMRPGISIAAAATAKKGAMLRLVAGTAMIPHIDKVDKGGEDAFCVSHLGLGSISVADGVSGWAEEGIDPAAYSRSLMRYTSEALEANHNPNGADPREVIRYAHMATVMAGSSTICVAVMKPCGKLQVANLGDSGVRLIREGRVVFASTAQQHMFNMPFQLSHPSIIESPDDADSADVNTLDVRPGDIIVLATDGLYDNMFDAEIAQICTDTVNALAMGPTEFSYSVAEAEMVAAAIARRAHAYAQNPHQRTPWSVAASETGLPWARFFVKGGGKMDDVTVVVGFVVPDDQA